VTENPYAPPEADAAGVAPADRPPKSFARRVSFVLAAVGVVGFWVPLVLIGARGEEDSAHGITAGGLALMFALTAHSVGIAIVFAAPRGRRLAPAMAHVAALVLIVAIVIVGLVVETNPEMNT
jgi:hypothetical protein